ncbi:MAG: PEP-utilizing enzyme [Clostridia bacterium]|nr:PEP-utilizing enzyme [Clostridia bacterium]
MIFVQSFEEMEEKIMVYAGGKGRILAKLLQSGYPVPEGFVIFPFAFESGRLIQAAKTQIQTNIDKLRIKDKNVSFAVRSSALSEDSEKASFAGEFETVLDVANEEDIYNAIYTVYNSRESKRVKAYSMAKEMEMKHDMAVVVQILVKADISGVLFTVDPITGSRADMIGNYVHGMGEALVSGEATPYSFKLKRPKGTFDGPALFKRFAGKLYKLALNLENNIGTPQDIEWAITGRRIYILQSRPVTNLKGNNPITGEWNDSLAGDYLWSNANLTEATPDVMTPLTWSLIKIMHVENQPFKIPGDYPMVGNIGGHPYINLSLLVSMIHVFGTDVEKILNKWVDVFGLVPKGIDVPLIPFKITQLLATIPDNIRWEFEANRLYKELPGFIESNPRWCENARHAIQNSTTNEKMASLWIENIKPHYILSCQLLRVVMKKFQEPVFKLRPKLKKLVGLEDANILLSNLRGNSSLASIEPLIALSKLADGKISREEYLKQYGHRGPHEFETSIPGADENPGWIEQQLESFRKSPVDVELLLSKQQNEYDEAMNRLKERHPKKYKYIKSKLEEISYTACIREALRSEFVRTYRVLRVFAGKAGELTKIKDDIFFLYVEEILDLLSGKSDSLAYIEIRRETHKKYCSLPPYPMLINGGFDIFRWADDPDRRSDLYDSHSKNIQSSSDIIRGFAGAAGVVEGIIRRLENVEEGDLLQPGEILVTTVTNIGWTPLFPRAAAIVTDVGAPLSHAAIVARELGIPAVVGCGNATMLLNTGDRVRVDGGTGIVRIIDTTGN